ncbi:methyltransferase domain-containing protein [Streptomyces sp. 4503]|uniref:Methyltransferase domain-containing protein n=1 Tax=Streptomyces niphimycinicus TaxID=2842201 RepID=A0ABS6CSM1_9ACTN|nr:methyltransferase domain-containing protein [Streptomyces niphimycinicus]MBU3869951.1 methyltransferase domain-containing protein [Streptomyces niphimycinicus]
MSVSERYRQAWESYWQQTSDAPGDAIWDADPSLSAAPHLALLAPYADPSLPIVDLGCGNGTQTRYLASRFGRAVGVDLSRAAVERARGADPAGAAEYRQLGLTDAAGVAELARRLGDANVYMRAVIHQSDAADRRPVAEAVTTLLGRRGRGFVVELTAESKAVLAELAASPGGPPLKLRRVFDHGLRPADAADKEVPEVLAEAGLEILAEGPTALAQTEQWPDGSRVELPARWFVVSRV